VVQGEHRHDAGLQQRVYQPAVVIQAGLVGRAAAERLDPRPRHREPVGAQAEFGHQPDVLRIPVVVIHRDVTGVAVAYPAG
jgi:hypothetical protein